MTNGRKGDENFPNALTSKGYPCIFSLQFIIVLIEQFLIVSKHQNQINRSCHSEWGLTSLLTNENWKKREATSLTHEKTLANKFGLVLFLHLIGWDGGANFFQQLQGEVKPTESNPRSFLILNRKLLLKFLLRKINMNLKEYWEI